MWKTRVPPKVRDFMWRALSGCLPTNVQLRIRHVPVEMVCPLCLEQNESVTHCLAGCRLVWPCWQQLGFDILAPSSDSFQAWVRGFIFQLNDDQRCRFFMLCWAIWRRRNEWVWRKKKGSVQEILYVADCTLQNWIQAQDKELTPMPSFLSGEDGVSSWKKPPVGKLKI
ncbi:uncharacterized protein LOC133784577 [Humulus lupulus]|uniref:uncharacterized protein LOC133784577 n=1 Tax=Humulus lupulus TaxID=3486 RepID=UPI002B410436|nr:uncharacterized protein LOC133784577 [Humulus lupulus]